MNELFEKFKSFPQTRYTLDSFELIYTKIKIVETTLGQQQQIVYVPINPFSSEDYIRCLLTFKTKNEWLKEQEQIFSFTPSAAFVRTTLDRLWDAIPKPIQDEIDLEVYHIYDLYNDVDTRDKAIKEGQRIREERGFADPDVRKALQNYCQKKSISLTTPSFELKQELEDTLSCPIELSPTDDLSILVPCGHTFSEKNIQLLTSHHCPKCRQMFTSHVPNFMARDAAAFYQKNFQSLPK